MLNNLTKTILIQRNLILLYFQLDGTETTNTGKYSVSFHSYNITGNIAKIYHAELK